MSTEGIVSVVKGGRVAMKIVAGCNGMTAPKVAEAIRTLGRVPATEEALHLAAEAKLGCDDCLVIQEPGFHTHFAEDSPQVAERYLRTFF